MRGGAPCPAARLLWALPILVAEPLRAQAPVRTRDVGFATVAYDNGLTLGALTLNESATVERERALLFANGLVSLFNDGRWSMQGTLAGARFSEPLRMVAPVSRGFDAARSELGLTATSTAQQGFMPTLQVTGHAKLHLTSDERAARVGAAIARTFDGFAWRTTVMGEAGGWASIGPTVVSVTALPMQLQYGDFLGDIESYVSWLRGRVTWDAAMGVRLGEARRGTVAWGSLTAVWPVARGVSATASVGSYPVDLIQSLPSGRYVAIGARLPGGRLSALFSRPAAPRPPPPPVREPLPITERLALVIGPALDTVGLREIRVWAPGIRRVELMADFTEWVPVPLIRQSNGEWVGYYRVSFGTHRVNVRLNGEEVDVPVNLTRVKDDFVGGVGLVVVR